MFKSYNEPARLLVSFIADIVRKYKDIEFIKQKGEPVFLLKIYCTYNKTILTLGLRDSSI